MGVRVRRSPASSLKDLRGERGKSKVRVRVRYLVTMVNMGTLNPNPLKDRFLSSDLRELRFRVWG